VGEKGPSDIKGCGNYLLPEYDSKGEGKVAALLYCLDSNDYPPASKYGDYDWIHYDKIAWYSLVSPAKQYACRGERRATAACFGFLPYSDIRVQ
jgi:hypothetical protein